MIFNGKKIDTSFINEIKIRKIYEYYDQPIFYSFYNENDSLFLAHLLLEEYSQEIWLYIGISHKNLLLIENMKLGIKEYFDSVKDQNCFITVSSNNDLREDYYISTLSNIDSNYLPNRDYSIKAKNDKETLSWEYDEGKTLLNNTYVLDLDLILENNPKKHSIEVDVIGRILTLFQELVFTYDLPKEASMNARYSKENREKNRALLVATNPGSFEMRIESKSVVNLLGDDPFAKASTELIRLFQNSSNDELIIEVFKNNNEKTVRKLTEIIYSFKGNDISGNLTFIKPFGANISKVKSSFDDKKLSNLIEKLNNFQPNQSNLFFNGTLTAINLNSKKFTMSNENNETITGTIDSSFFKAIVESTKFLIPSDGIATIQVNTEHNKYTNTVNEKYIMIDWNKL